LEPKKILRKPLSPLIIPVLKRAINRHALRRVSVA
jgi:hypothetical protein